MEQAAIQHIEENAVGEVLAQACAEMRLPVLPVPDSYKLQSIEKWMDRPQRFRGTFKTQYVEDFAAYAKDNLGATLNGARCFVDAEKMAAKLFLDLGIPGSPGHGDHTVEVALVAMAEYKALLAIINKPLAQRDAAEFIEDWRDHITAKDADDGKIDIKQAIQAVRALTIEAKSSQEHTTSNLSASKSALESIEASSKGKSLPSLIGFTCPPYDEIKTRTFTCRLGVLTGGKDPQIILRPILMEAHIEEMALEFRKLVRDALADAGIAVHLGKFEKPQ